MTHRAQTVVLGLALLAGACLGPHPPLPEGAAVGAPGAWRTPVPGSEAPLTATWWREFDDPFLTAAVEQALARNADVGQAIARVAQARAAERSARAQRGPEINFQNEGGRTRVLEVIGPVSATGDLAEVTLAWELDLFRRYAQADAAARASLLASEASRDAVKLSVASATASAYISLLGLEARLQIAKATLKTRAESLRLARRRADAGYSAMTEVRQAEAEYASTARLVPQVELAVAQEENALSVLVGDPPHAIPRAPRGLDGLSVPPIPTDLPSDLLSRRPDVRAAQDQVVAADHSLSSARRAMLPDFALTGNYAETAANTLPVAIPTYLFANTVLAPIFDSGRRKAAARSAQAQRDEAAFAFRGAFLTALQEVENALGSIGKLGEQRDALTRQVQADQKLLDIDARRYQAGYAASFDEIDARRQLLSAQLDQAQTRTDELNAIVQLFRALGGGWRAPVPTHPDRQGDALRSGLALSDFVADTGRTPGPRKEPQ